MYSRLWTSIAYLNLISPRRTTMVASFLCNRISWNIRWIFIDIIATVLYRFVCTTLIYLTLSTITLPVCIHWPIPFLFIYECSPNLSNHRSYLVIYRFCKTSPWTFRILLLQVVSVIFETFWLYLFLGRIADNLS